MKNKLPTIDIKGKSYVMVKDRILAFNELYPKGSIRTDMLFNDDQRVIVRATVSTQVGIEGRSFTGHSEAYRSGPMGDVPLEIAETSAVGRALAMLGIGIIESVASADEVIKATAPAKPASDKQKFTAQKVVWEKEGRQMSDQERDGLTSAQASAIIGKLINLPRIETGDSDHRDEGFDSREFDPALMPEPR